MSEHSTCSFEASLQGSIELIESLPEGNHKSPEAALGSIRLTKRCLEIMRSKIDCPGGAYVNERTGQLECPLREATMALQMRATTNAPVGNYAVDLAFFNPSEETIAGQTPRATGQYL
jgi:hypothetical protein